MSWLRLSLFGGQLKVKPASQLRFVELHRQVPVLNLGVLYISWWNRHAMEREQRNYAAPPRK